MNKILTTTLFTLTILLLTACTTQETQKVGLANPASVFCEKNGGKLNLASGECTLSDGTVCDEWAYFRGECGVDYEVAETTEVSCQADSECVTPTSYLIRSNCPYTSKCIADKCAVVCPKYPESKPVSKNCSGECPQFMPPAPGWCSDGRIVASEPTECGCRGPPQCVREEVACPEDAKLCPDGSSVSRVGPDCEFEACPCACPEGYLHDENDANICNPQCYYSTPKCLAPSIECSQTKPQEIQNPCKTRSQVCTMDYNPVCGYAVVQCIRAPCPPIGKTYGNACGACSDETVDYWVAGECPKI